MSNKAFDLPVPGSGAGASVDVSVLGSQKTIDVSGPAGLICYIEASIDGSVWCQVESFQGPGKKILDVAARFLRVRVTGAAKPTNVDVASNTDGTRVATFTIVPNGTSAPVDVSELGTFNTLIADVQQQKLVLQISQDNIDWEDCISMVSPENCESKEFTAIWARVVDSGSGASSAALCATNDAVTVDSQKYLMFVYRQDGVRELNVYNQDTMDDLEADMQATPGPVYLFWESSIATCEPPARAGNPYNMDQVSWVGLRRQSNLDINDDVTFTGLRNIAGELVITNRNTTSPVNSDLGAVSGEPDVVTCFVESTFGSGNGRITQDAAAMPFWDCSAAVQGMRIDIGGIFTGSSPIIDLGGSGQFCFLIGREGGFVGDDLLAGQPGDEYDWAPQSNAADIERQDATLGGAILALRTDDRPTLRVEPPSGSPPSTVALPNNAGFPAPEFEINTLARFAATAGDIAQTLPQISGATAVLIDGKMVMVSNDPSATANVLLTANAGDSIVGFPAGLVVGPGETVWLIAEGTSTWQLVSLGIKCCVYSVPETWAVASMPIGGGAMPTRSSNFTDKPAIRAGSVVGISARATGAVTGNVAATVTVNGAPGTLAAALAGVAEAQATQLHGVDTYVAGDKIGIDWASDSDNSSLEMEAWLEIAPI